MSYTITGEKEDLAEAFTTAARFNNQRHAVGAYTSSVKIILGTDERGDHAWIEATNDVLTVRTFLACTFTAAAGTELLLPGKLLSNIINVMPSGTLELKVTDKTMTISKGRTTFDVPLLDLSSYPMLDVGLDIEWDMVDPIPADGLLEAVSYTSQVSTKDDSKPHVQGANLRVDGDDIVVTSTDLFRLLQTRIKAPGFSIEDGMTLPLKLIDEMNRLYTGVEIKMMVKDSKMYFVDEDHCTYISVRRYSMGFPALHKMIPQEFDHTTVIDREEALAACNRMKVVADSNRPVHVDFGTEMKLTLDGQAGKVEEYVSMIDPTEEMSIGFNFSHLASALNVFDTDQVQLNFNHPIKPVLVTASGSDSLMLILPVRIA